MPSLAHRGVEETATANSRAYKGAAIGAVKWGILALGLGVVGHIISPVYKGLTPQFKVYIQISAMTVGGVIGAERSVRSFEFEMMREKRRRQHEGTWRRYESMLEKEKELELDKKKA